MNSVDRFNRISKTIQKCLYLVGVDCFENRGYINKRSLFCISVVFIGFVSILYTLIILRNDFILLLRGICSLMQALQGMAKLYTALKHRRRFGYLFEFLQTIYILNHQASIRRTLIVDTAVKKLGKIIKIILAGSVFILILIMVHPLYSILYLDKVELFLEIDFVGMPMSKATTATYVTNYGVQIIDLSYGYGGNVLFDVTLCVLVYHVRLLTELLAAAMDEIKDLIENDKKMFGQHFRNCIVMIQDIDAFVRVLKDVCSLVVFAQISTASVSLAICLFCTLKTDWLGAHGFVIWDTIKIFTYCFIGTYLEVTNEMFQDTIYNFPWYTIPEHYQKVLCFVLWGSQRQNKIMVGGFAELNIRLATEIFKRIYSYLMLLLNFVN